VPCEEDIRISATKRTAG